MSAIGDSCWDKVILAKRPCQNKTCNNHAHSCKSGMEAMIHDANLLCATSKCTGMVDDAIKLFKGYSDSCHFVAWSMIPTQLEGAHNKVASCVMALDRHQFFMSVQV